MEFGEFVDEYKYGGQLQRVLCGVFGWNKITVHLRGGELSLPNLKFLFLKTIQMGITVIYSIHVFYD